MSGPLRVLQVALSLRPGGAERLVVDLARALPAHGFGSAVCCLDEKGTWAAELEAEGIPVAALDRRPGFRPGVAVRLAALARRQKADVLHCHQYTPYVYGCLAKLLRPSLGLVFTEHGRLSDAPPSPKRRLVNPWLARIPGERFAVCQELRAFLLQEGFPEERLGVIYNGIAPGPEPGPSQRKEARTRLGLSSGAFAVGTVGRLDPVKDQASLIRAFAGAHGELPGGALFLVGDGPERAALERLAGDCGARGAISFLGNRTDVRDILPAFDLYVSSSRYEGVSLTIVEAMAAGVCVLATRVGGTPEVIADGESGMLVPAADEAALREAILAASRDPDRRQALAARGRAVARDRFDFERMLTRYEAAYSSSS